MDEHSSGETVLENGAPVCRRRVLQLAAVGAVVAGIGPSGVAPLGTGSAFAAGPKRGGVLKVAWASTPRAYDPAMSVVSSEYTVEMAVFDNLVRVDENLNVLPQLAESWETDSTATSYVFRLRKDVVFHNGRPMTSEDVVFTFKRVLDPKTGSPGRSSLGPITEVEAIDKYTVRLTLSAPYADLPLTLGGSFGRIVPADGIENIKTAPIGTGPFRLVEFRPGSHTRLVRNERYWDPGKPYLDELWQVTLPQLATQMASLVGNEIQFLPDVDATSLEALKKNSAVTTLETPSAAYEPIEMMMDVKPFDDVRVRLALKYLVDRPLMIKAAWQGHATQSADNPLPRFHPYWVQTKEYPYDVARARALLAEAGYPNGFSTELWTTNERPGLQEVAIAYQQTAAPGGVKIEVKPVAWNVYIANVWKKMPFYVCSWYGRSTIDETLSNFYSKGGFNDTRFNDPEIDKLLDTGRVEPDAAKRKEIYQRVQTLINERGTYIIPYHTNWISALRGNVKGYVVNPLRHLDFRNVYLET